MTAGRNEKSSFHTDFLLCFYIVVGFNFFFSVLFGVFSGALFVSFFFFFFPFISAFPTPYI